MEYFLPGYYSSFPNKNSISLQHRREFPIELLCVSYHLVGVAFSPLPNANSRCGSDTLPSNSSINPGKLGSPSYVGSLIIFVATQFNDWVIRQHFLIDTSCK